MQALLSFEQSPPFNAPLRFFLSAPLFGLLAGALLLWSGPALFSSRWSPSALALTHLLTAGFMLQVMLGALQQLLPVVLGANLARPAGFAAWSHAGLTLGTLVLVGAFLSQQPVLFGAAAVVLAGAGLGSVAYLAHALWRINAEQSTARGMKLALLALGITLGLGALMALDLGWSIDLSLAPVTNLHIGWGLLGWGGVLVLSVAYVVVPMFQITPAYPQFFTRFAAPATIAILGAWTLAEVSGWASTASALRSLAVAAGAVLAGFTLVTTLRSKRAKRDPTQFCWQLAMASFLLASALWLGAWMWPTLSVWPSWPMLWAVLVLEGGFVSVITGMLYKIVPFLVWLHLRHRGQGKVHAPNMKLILSEAHMRQQLGLHLAALLLLMLASWWPQAWSHAAGLALMAANAALLRNMLLALRVYRQHLRVIEDSPPKVKRH